MGRLGAPVMRRVLLLSLAMAGICAAQQEPSFTVDVKLVRLLATVKNSAGQLIGSLQKPDFQIFDNGVPQQIAVFERHTEHPLSVALLVDMSASTAIELKYELDSLHKFLKALIGEGNPNDSAAIFTFNYEVNLLQNFTRRLDVLERATRGMRPVGGTSLYDAIYLASQGLEEREGRHVMILITDGGDTTSSKKYHDALRAAQMADAVLYPILVMPITNDAGRNIGGENALFTLAQSTGGRMFTPNLGEALDTAFQEILRELRTQYLIGFYPKNVPPTKEPFHRLDVRLRNPDLRVLSRSGYYGDSEEGRGWIPVR